MYSNQQIRCGHADIFNSERHCFPPSVFLFVERGGNRRGDRSGEVLRSEAALVGRFFRLGLMGRNEKRRYRLASVCLHRGNRADFGHYVAAYREEGVKEWVLCNDSKVVLAADAPISECYLAFYEIMN